jgi:hypothetical protein
MQPQVNHTTCHRGTVYMIFRVFNFGNNEIGIMVLFDLEGMKLRDAPSFTAESWSVIAVE